MSAKRAPGRPLTPGNEPGSDGNAKLSIRLTPAQRAEVRARGGATWAREVLLRNLKASNERMEHDEN